MEKLNDGSWFCPKCEQAVTTCNYSYIAQLKFQDHTSEIWASAFDEAAIQLMGRPAEVLYNLQFDDETDECAKQYIRDVQHKKYILVVTCTHEIYNNEEHMKATITKASPIDFTIESNTLIERIKDMCTSQPLNQES